MNQISSIRSALYSLIIVAAAIGLFLYSQISKYPIEYNNISFIFAYILMLVFISMPVLISESISGFLSKKKLSGSLHYMTKSNRLRFVSLLSLLLAGLILIIVINNMSLLTTSLVYTSHWYMDHSPEKTLYIIHQYALTISVALSVLMIVILFITQTAKRFLNLSAAFSTLGIACLIGLFIMNSITFKAGVITTDFFIPNFSLLTKQQVWINALTLALFSGLIGLGINTVFGTYLTAQCSIRRFSWIFIIGSVIAAIVIMLIQNFYVKSTKSASEILGFEYAYTLNLLAFGLFFFCLLTAAILLCQTFKGLVTQNIKNTKWYVYLPFFILLLAAVIIYQHIVKDEFKQIIQSELIINLIFVITYIEILIFGWIFDAQRLSYQLQKATQIKLSAIYNLSLRLIAPSIILSAFIQKIYNIWVVTNWLTMLVIFILSLIVTTLFGSFLHRHFQ
ncbi:hypothetical protein [Fastidiosibacter lacustris]|uniref:hypothetical protein n=1 Tax=Fastidiosibacter lacustris TaxID=2056695 RepID=UPI000E345394|nr:hypothetical protein [Fastidiosibacter lacustris]